MRLPRAPTLERRGVLSRAMLAVLSTSLSSTALLAEPQSAQAAYTVIPSGTVAQKSQRLKEVEKLFAKTPDDPYVFGEKAQLEYDIGQLQQNGDYARQVSRDIVDGKANFIQSIRVEVPDMAEAVRFWRNGVGCLLLNTRLDADGSNVTRLAFGSQSFKRDDGAKFALELVQPPSGYAGVPAFNPETTSLQYLQIAIPSFRLSQVMNYGGTVVSAYGWTEARAPGGLPMRVRIDETRRDPFEFVALRASKDLKASTAHFEDMGMSVVKVQDNSKKLQTGGSWGVSFVSGADAFEPDREQGTVQLNFLNGGGEKQASLSTGILLLPPKKKKVAYPPMVLDVLGKQPEGVKSLVSPDGLQMNFVDLQQFEAALKELPPSDMGIRSLD